MTQQLLSIRRTAEPVLCARISVAGTVMRAGATPAGVLREGSTTHTVLEYLRRRGGRSFVTRRQILVATGRSQKAVDWALHFLRAVELIETTDDPRCTRYLRYRARPGWEPKQRPESSG